MLFKRYGETGLLYQDTIPDHGRKRVSVRMADDE